MEGSDRSAAPATTACPLVWTTESQTGIPAQSSAWELDWSVRNGLAGAFPEDLRPPLNHAGCFDLHQSSCPQAEWTRGNPGSCCQPVPRYPYSGASRTRWNNQD